MFHELLQMGWPCAIVLVTALICSVVVYGIRKGDQPCAT